jgi:hypothetical protein
LQLLQERRNTGFGLCIFTCDAGEDANAPHALALLRPRREGPRSRRAAEQRDERAPPQ